MRATQAESCVGRWLLSAPLPSLNPILLLTTASTRCCYWRRLMRLPRLLAPLCTPWARSYLTLALLSLLALSAFVALHLSHTHARVRHSWFEQVDESALRSAHHSSLVSSRHALEALFARNLAASRHREVWDDAEFEHHPLDQAAQAAQQSGDQHWTPHSDEREQALLRRSKQLCIVLTTVPRKESYFLNALASLLHSLSPALQQSTSIYVLNAAIPQ